MNFPLRQLAFTSLRARLLFLLLSASLLLWGMAAVMSYVEAHHEIDELYDAHLAGTARILLSQVGQEAAEVEGIGAHSYEEHGADYHKYERKIAFQVWDAAGKLVMRSANAPTALFIEDRDGFGDARINNRTWRVFSHWDEKHHFRVQIGERHDVRDELTESVVYSLVYPFLFALPLLALLVWLGIGKGLAPLRAITADVARRKPQNLQPLEADGAPDEIRPLVASLNGLLTRLNTALENERRFTADAAHELRTPLAALKTQAQVAQRSIVEDERRHALRQVVDSVDRATHLVEQLLTLARLDPGAVPPRMEKLALRTLAVECAAALAPQAMDKSIEISVAESAADIVGNAAMLRILLRNLVDNAIRYTPRGGWVTLDVQQAASRVVLVVSDSGPGIAPEERGQVVRRFYRVLGSFEEGSGLGLSIVQRIAELHGATVALGESAVGGLAVRVGFPPPENVILPAKISSET
ncbi:MAG: ATP-binding protein [Sulfuricellaceae bacterium]